MSVNLTIRDKGTGGIVDRVEVDAQPRITNFQATICWNGITKSRYGESEDAAIERVFREFIQLDALRNYEITLQH